VIFNKGEGSEEESEREREMCGREAWQAEAEADEEAGRSRSKVCFVLVCVASNNKEGTNIMLFPNQLKIHHLSALLFPSLPQPCSINQSTNPAFRSRCLLRHAPHCFSAGYLVLLLCGLSILYRKTDTHTSEATVA
jgi:hypothetical protein